MLWDIFCKVIDNHGDIGVCWRLSVQLAERDHQVRLWVDDASALSWMAPQGHTGVRVMPWSEVTPTVQAGQAVIEAFGCELPASFQGTLAAQARAGQTAAWINLEYLSAESFAERSHGLPSPVATGPAAGLVKYFFYPGFTASTGGLLRETGLAQSQTEFDRDAWLRQQGIPARPGERLVCLFCYEPAALDPLLAQCASGPQPTRLLVTAGRAAAAVRAATEQADRLNPGWNQAQRLSVSWLPLLSQLDFDHLLWACDLNFVRGEDSLVRALWAGKPLVWQIYPQHDGAHQTKLEAFLQWLDAPASLRSFHRAWNGMSGPLPLLEPAAWTPSVRSGSERLLAQDDLATQLIAFARDAGRLIKKR